MAIPRSEEIKDLAIKYSKQQLAQLAQRGEVDPTTAIMAGMMRDRIVQSEMIQQMPDTTVFQDTFTPKQDMASAVSGPPQDQLAQMRAPVEGQPQMAMMAQGGLASLDVPDDMVPDEYAGGGIIAFAKGGMTAEDIERLMREAEQGRGPNVSRPRDINRLPQGLTPEDAYPFAAVEEEVVEEVPAPSTGLGGLNIGSIVDQATQMASAIRPETTRTVPTIQEASGQTNELLAASGYDTGIFDKIRQDVEQQRESLKGDRSEAVNMRLIEAGLGIMGGTSANAFENIGKGATGAMKGLAQDFKDIKKSERDLQAAQQNLMMKQNDAAMGKAKITQSTIDKAQERVDKELENYNRNIADLSKTLLAGDIQERIARASYGSKITDYDKKWARYVEEAKGRGETPTFSGFENALRESMGALTFKEALRIAAQDKGLTADEIEAQALKLMEVDKRRKVDAGGRSQAGSPPPLPAGFVLQQ
jgi:hypothetical protein